MKKISEDRTQHYERKKLQRYHLVCFLLAIYYWALGLHIRVVCFPREIALGEKKQLGFHLQTAINWR